MLPWIQAILKLGFSGSSATNGWWAGCSMGKEEDIYQPGRLTLPDTITLLSRY